MNKHLRLCNILSNTLIPRYIEGRRPLDSLII